MTRAYIEVIGSIWWPAGVVCAQRKDLSSYDVENVRGYAEHLTGDAQISRDAIEHWLALNSGDFQHVKDFHAVIGAFESPWADEDSECTYCDAMFPADE